MFNSKRIEKLEKEVAELNKELTGCSILWFERKGIKERIDDLEKGFETMSNKIKALESCLGIKWEEKTHKAGYVKVGKGESK